MKINLLDENNSPMSINANTGISIGIVVVLLGGFTVVLKGITDNKNEVSSMKYELSTQAMTTKTDLSNKIDKLETRMTNLESGKGTWTSTDMFKWAVHLQQSNSDPKKLQTEGLKVPEPETGNK